MTEGANIGVRAGSFSHRMLSVPPCLRHRTTLTLICPVPRAPQSRSHKGTYIFRAPSGADVAQIDHVAPAEHLQDVGDLRLRFRVVTCPGYL